MSGLFYVYFKKPKFALNEWVIGKIKVNFVRERFSACQSSKLTRFLFINDCDEKALSNWKVCFSFLIKI